jgi:hypothetical protein
VYNIAIHQSRHRIVCVFISISLRPGDGERSTKLPWAMAMNKLLPDLLAFISAAGPFKVDPALASQAKEKSSVSLHDLARAPSEIVLDPGHYLPIRGEISCRPSVMTL